MSRNVLTARQQILPISLDPLGEKSKRARDNHSEFVFARSLLTPRWQRVAIRSPLTIRRGAFKRISQECRDTHQGSFFPFLSRLRARHGRIDRFAGLSSSSKDGFHAIHRRLRAVMKTTC